MPSGNDSNEIHITRVYDAPVKAVWDAWVDPKQVAQWWGPRGFTLTTRSKDVRTGGTWDYTMHGPDGVDWPNFTRFIEVVPRAKLVYDHGGTIDKPPMFRVTVTFAEQNGKTTMSMTMTLPTPEAAKQTRHFIKKAGGDATWDRLAEYLSKESAGKNTFVINRAFDAPIDIVFEVWTRPEHVSNWLSPTGTEMQYIEADIRTGGGSFYKMSGPNYPALFGKMYYVEISAPHRVVYTQWFCDEQGNMSRHPLAPTWPEKMLTVIDFVEDGPGRTRLTVTWEPFGPATQAEIDTFINARAGMTGGWTGSFDKLEAYLESRQSRPSTAIR